MYTPYFAREREPCQSCGTRSYINPVQGDCVHTQGYIFCSDECKWKHRWRDKFKHYPQFQTPALKPCPSNE